MYCLKGALYVLTHDDAPPPTTSASTTTTTTALPENVKEADGSLTELSSSSITVGTLTCQIGAGSPATSGFQFGNAARMYSLNGFLYVLRHNDPTTTTGTTTTGTTTTTTGRRHTTGTTTTTGRRPRLGPPTSMNAPVTALSSSSNTVGTLTCQIGAGSPSTNTFKVGDVVIISCTNGALTSIALDSF